MSLPDSPLPAAASGTDAQVTNMNIKAEFSLPYVSELSFGDAPGVAESDVSSEDGSVASVSTLSFLDTKTESTRNYSSSGNATASRLCTSPEREPLQWEFTGLTLWLELEEFDSDLTKAVEHAASTHGVQAIPKSHTTAIYGMEHLSVEEAKAKLHTVKDKIPSWPAFGKPVGIVQDIAVAGRPGQVCTIAWSELTLPTSQEQEAALDTLYEIFYGADFVRHRPWKPHNSIAYDNPDDSPLNLLETVSYIARNPTLLGMERRVEAISLWSTYGKLEDWKCLDRVRFW